ncbi:MAG: prolyl oligopeptidase family serine peptidase [Alphaproteobacteria bacterium]|nr:prolyl oligopeptidase family serine peptidase [Alphaproteobacteria bacterium]
MAGFFELDGPRFGPAAGGPAQQLVILLHGLGADGQDLIGIAPHWAQVLPNAAFVSPNAPFPCDMAPHGYQWFSVQDRSPEAMLSGVRMAAAPLDAFIDRELESAGLDESRTALVGFSQGTMMSLFVGPRRARQLAGIVGFSGRLIAPELLADEIKSRPPVLLAHGTADEVVPYASLDHAANGLRAAGIAVETLSCPGIGHGIDQSGLVRAAEFLHEALTG